MVTRPHLAVTDGVFNGQLTVRRVQGPPGIPHTEAAHRLLVAHVACSQDPSEQGFLQRRWQKIPEAGAFSRAGPGTLGRRGVRSPCSRPPWGSPGRWGRRCLPSCSPAKTPWPPPHTASLLSTGPLSPRGFGRLPHSPERMAPLEGGSAGAARSARLPPPAPWSPAWGALCVGPAAAWTLSRTLCFPCLCGTCGHSSFFIS